ncbi:MAG: prephenate dehydratase domain-containing protein [Patescibacteria group bacterium]
MQQKYIFGIQGGKGSFNEEACVQHCEEKGIKDYSISYLYTTEKVLAGIDDGSITHGQFAIQNAIGGMVSESVHALSRHICTIADEFLFEVHHCLLVRPGINMHDVKTIMSHPQALAQCQHTLARIYKDVEKKSGEGDYIDQARLAEELGKGNIDDAVAVLAPKICASLFSLDVVAEGLQDMHENFTTFLWVTK